MEKKALSHEYESEELRIVRLLKEITSVGDNALVKSKKDGHLSIRRVKRDEIAY